MKKKSKKTVSRGMQRLTSVLFGILLGILLVLKTDSAVDALLLGLLLCAALIIAYMLQIILHELGHLVFGLLTGYRFISFRIMKWMFIRQDGRLRIKQHHVAGTSGQCLLDPPDMVNGRFPYVLYNLGGVLMNTITAVISLLLCFAVKSPVLSWLMLIFSLVGFFTAITNGVPMHTKTINNDGANLVSMTHSPEALRAAWIQLKINTLLSQGKSLPEMPEEWFALPSDEAMRNSFVATLGVYACSRLLEQFRFDEADATIRHLLSIDSGITGIHRDLLTCDRIYMELIGENRPERVEELMTPSLGQLLLSMRNFPQIMRMQYAYALLHDHDERSAVDILVRFDKVAESYPYPQDAQFERQLMRIAEEEAISNI